MTALSKYRSRQRLQR